MPSIIKLNIIYFPRVLLLFGVLVLASCGKTFVKNPPKNKFYLYKNKIEVNEVKLSKTEKKTLESRLLGQLTDSSKVKITKKWGIINLLKKPVAYDTNYTIASCENMRGSLFHLGYYQSDVQFYTDTIRKKITVHYKIKPGKTTIIESIQYKINKPELQSLIKKFEKDSYLQLNKPITKAGVITEISRLVDSFRNNGYYKFTASELKLIGDTTLEALSTLNADPFEQLRLLNEAQLKKDIPTIRLTFTLNQTLDSSRLQKYKVNNIFILSDYRPGDQFDDKNLKEITTSRFKLKYHASLFKTKIIEQNLQIIKGSIFNQDAYNQTIYNFTKSGVWQSVNIQMIDVKDSNNLVDVYIELAPSKKLGFETALEVSYSAASNTSNVLAGNLFGLSGNISLLNRNLGREAIRMTHNIRAGIEFNNNSGVKNRLINSNEIGYSNSTSFPRLIYPGLPNLFNKKSKYNNGETFINLGIAYNTRLDLFNLRNINAGLGWTGNNRKKWKWVWSPINIGYSNLLNPTDSFKKILGDNPFLNYSYNTALVNGMRVSFSKTMNQFLHPNSLSKEMTIIMNAEESGLTWGLIPLFNKIKRRYIKTDFEIKHTIVYTRSTLAMRGFIGVGVPLLGSDTNRTLPFFKQYFGGGSNSLRAWPVRGIGPGGRPLIPYSSNKTIFNDRTGDMQMEANIEYRYDIARIIPNTLTLRGAVFTDIGNIWNIRSTKSDGSTDSTQFNFKTFYQQLGVAAGTGLRLDFNYIVLRLDFGFRFKRPEYYYNNDGWRIPNIGFDDLFKKLFTRGVDDVYKKWRYENFNFTIGIGYSF
jgi:outer membrane protein assembly factor BamA